MHVKYVVLLIWEFKKNLFFFCLLKLSKTRTKKCIVFLFQPECPNFAEIVTSSLVQSPQVNYNYQKAFHQ